VSCESAGASGAQSSARRSEHRTGHRGVVVGDAGGFAASEVIRPAAILPEAQARLILAGLEADDARHEGRWIATPGRWDRWDHAWPSEAHPGDTVLLGTISCAYDHPRKFEITIFRASITEDGVRQGWTVERLCDEALSYGDLTLASCPRAELAPPPPVFRWRDAGPEV
jgi:hypothetical protein